MFVDDAAIKAMADAQKYFDPNIDSCCRTTSSTVTMTAPVT